MSQTTLLPLRPGTLVRKINPAPIENWEPRWSALFDHLPVNTTFNVEGLRLVRLLIDDASRTVKAVLLRYGPNWEQSIKLPLYWLTDEHFEVVSDG